MTKIRSMDEALVFACERALAGDDASPRGMETREALGVQFRLENPRARWIHNPARDWSEAFAIGELCWHLSGSDEVDFVAYYAPQWREYSDDGDRIWGSCYGKKIFQTPHSDEPQWERVKRLLQHDSQSRRAVLSFPRSDSDPVERTDLPCISTIQFLVRDGRLHCFGVMRSNDAIWGLSYDVFFVTMLQELLARELGVELGWYEHYAASMHVYERHFDLARRLVEEGVPSSVEPMAPMTNVDAIPRFLRAEAALRRGHPHALAMIDELPSYWRNLAAPLVSKARESHEEAQVSPAV